MPVLISMSLAVLIWSLYPLAAVDGLKEMSGFELIAVSSMISCVTIVIFFFIYFKKAERKGIYGLHKEIFKSSYISIIGSGATHILCHSLFFIALSMSDKGGVSLIYECWPIIAVIATPFLIKKEWAAVGFKEFAVGLVALLGVVIIILSNKDVDITLLQSKDLTEETDYIALLGYIVAFIGAYACAMNVVLKGVVSDKFKGGADKMGVTIISELYCRVIGFALILLIYPFFSQYFSFDNIDWLASTYIGFVVMVLGGALYTYALTNTNKPTIHILYYFAPVIAVMWLWLANETIVSLGLFIGGGIVVICNIYLAYVGGKSELSEDL